VHVKGPQGSGVLSGIVAIAAGGQFSLALTHAGNVWAWGANDRGQLGDNSLVDRLAPVPVRAPQGLGLVQMKAIAAGSAHALALHADGRVWSWGWNSKGQLGDGTTADRSSALRVKTSSKGADLEDVKAIAAGGALNADLVSIECVRCAETDVGWLLA